MNRGKKCRLLFIKWILVSVMIVSYSCSPSNEESKKDNDKLPLNAEKGKQIFHTRCANCHRVNQEITGPALRGVEARWPDKQKLYAFIRNSEEVIRNDKYARELWLQYNQTIMLAQPDLTDADIRAVLDYINSVSQN